MPYLTLRLLMGENFPDTGSVVFTACWNGQVCEVGPIQSQSFIIVERDIKFEAHREDVELKETSVMVLGYHCLRTRSKGSCTIIVNLYNLFFQKTCFFSTENDHSEVYPMLNICFLLDMSYSKSLATPLAVEMSISSLGTAEVEQREKDPLTTDEEGSFAPSSTIQGSHLDLLNDPKLSSCSVSLQSLCVSPLASCSSKEEMTFNKESDVVSLEVKSPKKKQTSGQTLLRLDKLLLKDPKLEAKCCVLLERIPIQKEQNSKIQKEQNTDCQASDVTLELSDDEENVSSGSKDNVYIPDPSSEDSRISEDLYNTFDSSHRLSFLSLPDLNRNSQKKRQLNFSELQDPMPKRLRTTNPPRFHRPQSKLDPLLLQLDTKNGREQVAVDQKLAGAMKRHQKEGVQFMWKTCFETSKSTLSSWLQHGCILAHSTGLGKSLQVIAFAHTLLSNKHCKVKKILVVCRKPKVLNWVGEFEHWLSDSTVPVYEFASQPDWRVRALVLNSWVRNGGVMIVDYDVYRSLTRFDAFVGDRHSNVWIYNVFKEALVKPGPDVVVCDEGQVLSKESSQLFESINRIATKCRIVLTALPLLNSLVEYYTMVEFVKPDWLSSREDFTRKFVDPIEKGVHPDSSNDEVQAMRRRAFVLNDHLSGIVQHKGHSVLTECLPNKCEYVIMVRMSEIQGMLYQYYIENYAQGKKRSKRNERSLLLVDYNELRNVWSHPKALTLTNNESEEFTSDSEDETEKQPQRNSSNQSFSRSLRSDVPWWTDLVSSSHGEFDAIEKSGKMLVLFDIIRFCEQIGEKLVVFCQSAVTLDVVEFFLAKEDEKRQALDKPRWCKNQDYFRVDGKTAPAVRLKHLENFNDSKNRLARLLLLSTRAARPDVSLTNANRVVLFDVSWNPNVHLQSILRLYRLGQKEQCFIYRLVACGTMEEHLYNVQVSKMFLGETFADISLPGLSKQDLQDMYCNPSKSSNPSEGSCVTDDPVLARLVVVNDLIKSFHQHDSFLLTEPSYEMSEEERRAAWRSFYES